MWCAEALAHWPGGDKRWSSNYGVSRVQGVPKTWNQEHFRLQTFATSFLLLPSTSGRICKQTCVYMSISIDLFRSWTAVIAGVLKVVKQADLVLNSIIGWHNSDCRGKRHRQTARPSLLTFHHYRQSYKHEVLNRDQKVRNEPFAF